jgi:hypothetical protein
MAEKEKVISQDRARESVFHQLPAAPAFSGREAELEALRAFWLEGHGVMSLIGIGGAGKTACAERFLAWVRDSGKADSVIVWSFYDDPDANHFLKSAYRYLTGEPTENVSGAGWFSLLAEVLASGKKMLFLLDGLERVQREQTDASGIYGELEDTLLRGLLVRICSGTGKTKALITSRFPVASLEKWSGKGYGAIDVDRLTGEAAHRLIRSHGVEGDEDDISNLALAAGEHALTIDLLASAVSQFYERRASVAPGVVSHANGVGGQAQRLSAVLRVFEENLTPSQVDLLKCLCVFRFGVTREALESVFVGTGKEAVSGLLATTPTQEIDAILNLLIERHLVYKEPGGRFTVHPTVRDHFYRLFRERSLAHGAIKEHLIGLTRRPGLGPASDKASLDLLEELIYHSIKAGAVEEATDIYYTRMGGSDHLNNDLGEYSRTIRILQAFDECPDKSGMYHCHRAFGEFDRALEFRPTNRYIRLLNGHLVRLANDLSPSTAALARALQGESVKIPDRTPDVPFPSSFVHILRGDLEEAERVAGLEVEKSIYQDDRSRSGLALAEVMRQRGQIESARKKLDEAYDWVLHSGSQEHLCLALLVRSRLLFSEGETTGAVRSAEEGLQLAADCDFVLLQILFLTALSAFCSSWEPDRSRSLAESALELSSRTDVNFGFGSCQPNTGTLREA